MDIHDFVSFFRIIDKYNELLISNKLNSSDIEDIKKQVNYFNFLSNKINEFKCNFERILNYYELLRKGFTNDEVIKFINEDNKYLNECKNKLKEFDALKGKIFGYPFNMMEDSAVTKYLRFLESKLHLTNVYEFRNDNEKRIVKIVKNNLNLDDNYNGYIAKDGNAYGINLGLKKYPNAYLYYSSGSNYDVNNINAKKIMIDNINDHIDTKKLFIEVEKNYWDNKSSCIFLLNYGTYKLGAIDDIKLIKNYLVKRNIPHYIHVDASLYGGIDANQQDVPHMDFKNLDVDSISISLHNYIGLHECKEILLCKNDNIFLKSDDYPLFSTYQKVKEYLERSEKTEYSNNIKYFINMLNKEGIPYYCGNEKGNIFVILKPSDEICKKYQLFIFEFNNFTFARIIIFPYYKENEINELIRDLALDIKNDKIYKK